MNKITKWFNTKHTKSILKILFAIVFIAAIIYEGREELSTLRVADVKIILKDLPPYVLISFILGGILTASISFIHDLIISKELTVKLSRFKIFKIGFLSNTLNSALGGLSSAGVRIFLYDKEGVNSKESTFYNILIVTSFSTGLSALTLLILLNFDSIRTILEKYEFALVAIYIIIFYVPLYFMINKFIWLKKKLLGVNSGKVIPYSLLRKLFISSIFEWTMTALFFCAIAMYFSPNASFIDIFSVFIISSVIGVVSLIPGAIGAFDVTLLLGMSTLQINTEKAAASLMIFRVFYYLVPLAIAFIIALPQIFKKRIK